MFKWRRLRLIKHFNSTGLSHYLSQSMVEPGQFKNPSSWVNLLTLVSCRADALKCSALKFRVSHQPPCMLSCIPSPTSLHGRGRVVVLLWHTSTATRGTTCLPQVVGWHELCWPGATSRVFPQEALERALGPRRDSNYILVPFGANQGQAQEIV